MYCQKLLIKIENYLIVKFTVNAEKPQIVYRCYFFDTHTLVNTEVVRETYWTLVHNVFEIIDTLL